jgi:CRP-like cAMP-binding protein
MPSINRRDMRSNRLLQALPSGDYKRLERHLQLVSFTAKQSVYEPHHPIKSVYFPLNGALDLVKLLEGGESVSVATLGKEGFVGHAIILGTDRMPDQVLCEIPSTCAMMQVEAFREQAAPSSPLETILLRYLEALFNEAAQIAACNRFHSIQKRMARCLLLKHDRAGIKELATTHEFLAVTLGVRRATVTETVAILQKAGLIRSTRGRIALTDLSSLTAAACECYHDITEEYERVMQSGVQGGKGR